MSKKDFPTPNFSALAKVIIKDAISITETHSVNFFKESFFKEGFTDTSFQRCLHNQPLGEPKRLRVPTPKEDKMPIVF